MYFYVTMMPTLVSDALQSVVKSRQMYTHKHTYNMLLLIPLFTGYGG